MALFNQGSYGEVLEIIARETINAFVTARLNVRLASDALEGIFRFALFFVSILSNGAKNDWD